MAKSIAKATSTGSQPKASSPHELTQADAVRLASYRAYMDFYNGYQWEGLADPTRSG
jgi:hypothetical protein